MFYISVAGLAFWADNNFPKDGVQSFTSISDKVDHLHLKERNATSSDHLVASKNKSNRTYVKQSNCIEFVRTNSTLFLLCTLSLWRVSILTMRNLQNCRGSLESSSSRTAVRFIEPFTRLL